MVVFTMVDAVVCDAVDVAVSDMDTVVGTQWTLYLVMGCG